MSILKITDIKHVARLARLKLKNKEVEKYKDQLGKVINYIDELNEVNTSLVAPTSQTTGLTNVTRPDKVNENYLLTVEEATSGKDDVHNNYFVVPMLLKKRKDR